MSCAINSVPSFSKFTIVEIETSPVGHLRLWITIQIGVMYYFFLIFFYDFEYRVTQQRSPRRARIFALPKDSEIGL